jgi:hypothetical protein
MTHLSKLSSAGVTLLAEGCKLRYVRKGRYPPDNRFVIVFSVCNVEEHLAR